MNDLTVDECKDVNLAVQMLIVQAGRYQTAGREADSLRLNRAAVSLVEAVGVGSELAAQACGNLAWALVKQGNPEEALPVVQRAQAILENLDAPSARAECLGRHAVILSHLGQKRKALDLHRDEEQLYRELDDVAGIVRSLIHQVRLYAIGLQRVAEAADVLSQAHTLCLKHAYQAGLDDVFRCASNAAYWMLQHAADLDDDGEFTGAWDALTMAEKVAERFDLKEALALAKYNRALFAALRLRRLPEALTLAKVGVILAREAAQADLLSAAEELVEAIQTDNAKHARPRRHEGDT